MLSICTMLAVGVVSTAVGTVIGTVVGVYILQSLAQKVAGVSTPAPSN